MQEAQWFLMVSFSNMFFAFTHIEHLFGLFFAQSRARIGAAVARGMVALHAMGCSLMGVTS